MSVSKNRKNNNDTVGKQNTHSHKSYLEIANSICQALMVVVALITIIHTTSSWKEDRLSKRAYITFSRPYEKEPVEVVSLNKDKNEVDLKFNLELKNVGFNEAKDLSIGLYVFDRKTLSLLKFTSSYAVNGLPRDQIFDPEFYLLNPANKPAFVLVVHAKYRDPIINKDFENMSFQPYSEIRNGRLSQETGPFVTKEEEATMVNIINNQKNI